jgi:hypothetical protein
MNTVAPGFRAFVGLSQRAVANNEAYFNDSGTEIDAFSVYCEEDNEQIDDSMDLSMDTYATKSPQMYASLQ